MAVPHIQPAFTIGEVSPSLFGRTDLARFHVAASTERNMFGSYRGGAYSRAGTSFVGFSKQTGRDYPPRLVPFQFSINQGLALEFGHQYMRVVSNGAFVLENAIDITGATRASPCVLTVDSALGATSATVNAAGSGYLPGDLVTLDGGTFNRPSILNVSNVKILELALNAPGAGVYAPGDTVHLAGGTFVTAGALTVTHTQAISASVNNPGAGGPPGANLLMQGTTGTGTLFTAIVTTGGGGGIASVDNIVIHGDYTVNPTDPNNEPVVDLTTGLLVGASLSLQLGMLEFTISNAGNYTAVPSNKSFTQGSTSGSGTGATFQYAIFGARNVMVSDAGVYTSYPSNPVAQASTTGTGAGATFDVTTGSVAAFADDDWVYVTGVVGMTQLNGQTYVVKNATPTTIELYDVYGNPVDSSSFGAYTSGGTASVVYTLTTPWNEEDLKYLKYTQSKDVMSICCVNQDTAVEYQPYDLSRLSDSNWTLTPVAPAPAVSPPSTLSGVASATGPICYQYVVTSIDPDDGTESIASPIANITNSVDIASTAGQITLTWDAVLGIKTYNVYKAYPGYGASPPVGALFGFAGSAFGNQFIDTNIVADLSQVPPTYQNPFARGRITAVEVTNPGSLYTSVTFDITTSTGSGAVLQGVLVNGLLSAVIVIVAGQDYDPSDTVTVNGDGAGATASLTIGALSGTYPGVPSYIQQRRVYAASLNNPDTYWMSQPGSFTNFDSRFPSIDSDAITGSPWSTQVNGIQFMIPMPGGLVVLTGLQAWQLTGAGGSSLTPVPIGPSSQQAQPQAYNGCSPTVPPVRVDLDILYVQAKGSVYRNLGYQLSSNIYAGTDLTLNSSHLFTGFSIVEHAWCEEPYKVLWGVRNDGAMLSLTFVKPQEVICWARHDTNGLYESVCSVTEPPVDALYIATQRFPGDHTAYMIERSDNRIWSSVEDSWCVDCGLSLTQPTPNATLRANSATGLGALSGFSDLVGGANYSSATTATVVDDDGTGPGTGAMVSLTIVGGVITNITINAPGAFYVRPSLVIYDPSNAGSGASATLTLNNSATFTASSATFASGDVGKVIRMGGGIATVTAFTNARNVTASITVPITELIPNSGGIPRPQPPGSWTLTQPVFTVGGLTHLAGMTVTGLYDGKVIPPRVVSIDGEIDLPSAASSVVVGLGFTAQLQSIYLDEGSPTIQGQRKKIAAVTVRVESSGAFQIGTNQPDGSVQSPIQLSPTWSGMTTAPTGALVPYNSSTTPLFTGDVRIPVPGGFDTRGQAAVQQTDPLPLNILAFISEDWQGDIPQNREPRKQQGA